MSLTCQAYPHLKSDERGVPWIEGSNTKVVEVVLDHLAHGLSAEEIHLEHRHLTLAQIHSALSYYHDHHEEMNREIDLGLSRARQQRTQAFEVSPIQEKLRSLGTEALRSD